MDQLAPGSTIGILGGGQLARMLALAAAPLGFKCHIFCPDPESPAFQVSDKFTIADYMDESALASFADAVDVITYEFENVPAQTAAFLSARQTVAPDAKALEISQDRLTEKNFLQSAGVSVAGFHDVQNSDDLARALEEFSGKGVLKTRRFGYDGKGQIMIRPDEARTAIELHAELGNVPCVLEEFIPFSCEVSVIASRNAKGEIALFDVAENIHRNHILFTSTVPAPSISETTAEAALKAARQIIESLQYVGTMGVEFFVQENGELLVNEIAPRVHNSGHWTMDACVTCQFEQHIRAICGWSLGRTDRFADVVMQNLIGDEVNEWGSHSKEENTHLHLYGKSEARAGRKMAHINRVSYRV